MNNSEFNQGKPPSRAGENVSPAATADGAGDDGMGRFDASANDAFPRVFVHDLRNLLAPIRNAVQLLRLRGVADASLVSIADLIDRQTTGIGRMLDGLVDAAQTGHRDAAREPVKAPAAMSAAAAAPKAKRILIADDNHSLRVSLGNILEEIGYEVKAAGDGAEALALARTWTPAFVLLDIHMPKFDGFEVARQLRALFPPAIMQLVMMSGDTLNDLTVRQAKLAGFDHCVDKVDAIGLLQQLFEGNA